MRGQALHTSCSISTSWFALRVSAVVGTWFPDSSHSGAAPFIEPKETGAMPRDTGHAFWARIYQVASLPVILLPELPWIERRKDV